MSGLDKALLDSGHVQFVPGLEVVRMGLYWEGGLIE